MAILQSRNKGTYWDWIRLGMSLGILCTAGEQARRTYESPKRFGDSGNTGHNASSSSRVGNALKRSSRSGNEFRATPTSPSDSATRKTSETSLTHLNGSNTRPANTYQSPSTKVEEPHRSTKRTTRMTTKTILKDHLNVLEAQGIPVTMPAQVLG